MKIVLFVHSLLSDWNHGNAHFLRGVMTELQVRGHDVQAYEPRRGWSLQNLFAERGARPIVEFQQAYPGLRSTLYDLPQLNLDHALDGADLVIAHEWNEPELIAALGRHRARRRPTYRLLFHDTHHRSVTAPEEMGRYDLRRYDGVLAFGEVLREIYLKRGWTGAAWTWHEAADVRLFHPYYDEEPQGDLVWVGNWGDDERTAELQDYLIEPVRELGLSAKVYGVRYPDEAIRMLNGAGIKYGGWLSNVRVPPTFASYRCTVHVPRRPYVQALPGIPTIRVFEAMACGLPLVCSPWEDAEGLFKPGKDFLLARDPREMKGHLRDVLADHKLAESLSRHARNTILSRHTCAHRVNELLAVCQEIGLTRRVPAPMLPTLVGSATCT